MTHTVNQLTPLSQSASLPANPLDLPAATFKEGLERRKQNRAALMGWVRESLVEGIDFGKIHLVPKTQCAAGSACQNPKHFSKLSLFKPGAEKICGMLGLTIRYPTLADYEKAALQGAILSQIIMRCEIIDAGGRVVADGVGARVIAKDYGDINKALKMAGKSAHIDATLRVAGLSEVFTQDIEDMQQRLEADSIQQAEAVITRYDGITKSQCKLLEARIIELGLDRARVIRWMVNASHQKYGSFLELSQEFYQLLFSKLDQFAEVSHEH